MSRKALKFVPKILPIGVVAIVVGVAIYLAAGDEAKPVDKLPILVAGCRC